MDSGPVWGQNGMDISHLYFQTTAGYFDLIYLINEK